MKRNFWRTLLLIILAIVVAGCGSDPGTAPAATPTQESVSPTTSATPDACSPGQVEAEVQKVHGHMREFDDAANLAASLTQNQLSDSIANMQRIRREAEDEQIPACLTALKTYQLQHMNLAINTFIAFMRASDPQAIDCANIESNTEENIVCQNFALASQQHDQYTLELARLLGLTVVPATAVNTPSETPTP